MRDCTWLAIGTDVANDWMLILIGALVLIGAFCLGAAFGAWRIEEAELDGIRRGRELGFNEARHTFSRAPVEVPTVRGRG